MELGVHVEVETAHTRQFKILFCIYVRMLHCVCPNLLSPPFSFWSSRTQGRSMHCFSLKRCAVPHSKHETQYQAFKAPSSLSTHHHPLRRWPAKPSDSIAIISLLSSFVTFLLCLLRKAVTMGLLLLSFL